MLWYRCTIALLLFFVVQAEFNKLLPDDHIYTVFPTRKIFRMNFQTQCTGYPTTKGLKCEEQDKNYTIQFFRNNTEAPQDPMIIPTTTMTWNPSPKVRMMWFNTSYRQMNDWIEQRLEVPLDLWDFDYVRDGDDDEWKKTNISIEFSGSHIEMWYNWYKVCHIWLRDQAEDLTYSTHVKLTNFYGSKSSDEAYIFWYYQDNSMWCWVNCSLSQVFYFFGYYDEVLSPRTPEFQLYLEKDSVDRCEYYNCSHEYENYPRCLALYFERGNGSAMVDMRCVNTTYNLTTEIAKAKIYHEDPDLVLQVNYSAYVEDDILGVGVVNGVYSCLQRDYCHTRRSFKIFNSGPSFFRKLWSICACFIFFHISCFLAGG